MLRLVLTTLLASSVCFAVSFGLSSECRASDEEQLQRGAVIYREMCASCHGPSGEGVATEYKDPLIGDESIGQLTKKIDLTMPEGDPDACNGPDAAAVAAYIHHEFYSEAAQIRRRPPRVAFSRLTADQLRQSLADLYSVFDGVPQPRDERGVKAIYFDGDHWKNENKKLERVDPNIAFDFGRESPGEGMKPEAFYIYWEGGLRPEVTGRYEIIVRSSCSFVFELGKIGRDFIDNHVQSGDKTEFRRSVVLTAGRVYPFKIDFIQRKRKTELPPARISVSWIPPGGTETVIPSRNFIPGWAPPTYSLQTELPADDRSYGFERGIAVNRQWDDSTTSSAIEFAQIAIDELWPEYRRKHKNDSDDNRQRLRTFLETLVSTAFRRPLDDELRKAYIDDQLAETADDGEAIKRVLLLSLKSPRFLYPQLDTDQSPSQRAATRLALVLFDSLPTDQGLRKRAQENGLVEEQAIRDYARSQIRDYRVQAKMRGFFREWLNLRQATDLSKDAAQFPGFDDALVQDLRSSLDAFLDDLINSESCDYRQLYLADWSYTTERMAAFYGDAWKPLEAATTGTQKTGNAPGFRFGVLTHPYLMSALASHEMTSPIRRGSFVYKGLFGRTLKPPADAFAPFSPDLHPNLTTRERVTLQTSPESCQTCHDKMNDLGFALENFDAAGRYRTEERNKPIDAQWTYVPRVGEPVKFVGPGDLAKYLAEHEDSHRAFVSRTFQHFVKQPIAAYGPDRLDQLTKSFQASGFNIRDLIVEIAVVAAKHEPAIPIEE